MSITKDKNNEVVPDHIQQYLHNNIPINITDKYRYSGTKKIDKPNYLVIQVLTLL